MIIKIAIFEHEIWKLKKVPDVACGPSFYPTGSKWSLFALHAAVFEIHAKFQNFHNLAWILELEERSQVAYVLSIQILGVDSKLVSLYGQLFLRHRPIFKISIFGCKIWNLKTGPKVAYVLSFYLKESTINLCCSSNRRFWDTDHFLKFAYLGMKAGIWRSPKVAYVMSLYLTGSKLSLFLLYGLLFSG